MLTNILHRETHPFTPTELTFRLDAPQGRRAPSGARRYLPAAVEHQIVDVSPSDQVTRRIESCGDVTVEMVQLSEDRCSRMSSAMFDSFHLSPLVGASRLIEAPDRPSAARDQTARGLRFVLIRAALSAVAWFLAVIWLIHTGLKVDTIFATETGALVVLLMLVLTIASLAIEKSDREI
jgi:hypothetical protein